jgi:hypothetical protein
MGAGGISGTNKARSWQVVMPQLWARLVDGDRSHHPEIRFSDSLKERKSAYLFQAKVQEWALYSEPATADF